MVEPPATQPPPAGAPATGATTSESGPNHGSGDGRELAAAVLAVGVGGGLGVLATARTWSTVTITRLLPLAPVRHDVSGRTLQPGVTGLAVVALAGVLAVLATRGAPRRIVGGVLVLAGAGMAWWSLAGLSAVSDARGQQLVIDAKTAITVGAASRTHVTVHPAWIAPAAVGGLAVLAGGVVTLARGGRWRAMSARYESPAPAAGATAGRPTRAGGDPAGDEVARARADLALWQRLDRGEDPTVGDRDRTDDTGADDDRTDETRAGDTRADDTGADDTGAGDTRAGDTRADDTTGIGPTHPGGPAPRPW